MAGRPTDYNPEEHPQAIRALAAKWMGQREIAEALGIATTTLTRWLNDHPAFKTQYLLGKEDATDRVERSLYERATGYSHPSEKIVVISDGQGAGSHVERVDTTEHYPPDPTSLKMWLTNRRGKQWADKQTLEGTIVMSPEALAAARARAKGSK